MNRRRFLATSAALALAGCRGGDDDTPDTDPAPSESPLPPQRVELSLNIQPGEALEYLPMVVAMGVRQVRASWWEASKPEDWKDWYPAYQRAGIEVLPLVYGGVERLKLLRESWGDFPYYQIHNEPDDRRTRRTAYR
jgi:hypothetical protein